MEAATVLAIVALFCVLAWLEQDYMRWRLEALEYGRKHHLTIKEE